MVPFCPACRSEFRPGFDRCEECDADLVSERPPDPLKPQFIPRVTVFQSTRYPDTFFMASLLESNGIHTVIDNVYAAPWLLGMPTPAVPLRVQVPQGDAEAAAEIIRSKSTDEPPVAPPANWNGRWLLALALLIPFDGLSLGGSQPFAAAGAWATLALGLILNLRDRLTPAALTEAKIGLFFLLGCFSLGLTLLIPVPEEAPWKSPAEFQFLVIGPVEEAAKLIPVFIAMTLADRRNRFAWILAGAASGAGFAMVENLIKFQIYRSPDSALIISAAGLLHPALTGFVGFMIARAGWGGAIGGLAVASLLHGAWNTLVHNELAWMCLFGLGVAAWVYFTNIDRWIQGLNPEPAPASA